MPFSLPYATDERHDLQSMAVEMVDETLKEKKSTLEHVVAATDQELIALTSSESHLGTAVTEADAA